MRFPTPSLSRGGARPCDGCSSHPMGDKGREMICDHGLSAFRHHVARVRAGLCDAVPSGESRNNRNEELLDRLLCVTARDDALAPADILRAARDLRPSVGGAMPMYSRISNAER